jgi:hygromycin-B 7''-O-kinase
LLREGTEDQPLALARAVCTEHGLPAHELRRFSQGTNPVFAVGDAVLKLYPPRFSALAAPEVAVLRRAAGQLPVATPQVQASGVVDGWPYLVMCRLGGQELHAVWPALDEAERQRIVTEVGSLLAALHALPADDLPELVADWPAVMAQRRRDCVARHRSQGAPEALIDQMPAFLASAAPLFPPDFRPVIVSGDVHDYHLLVEQRGGRWQLSGLFDFDDARLGHAEYDLAATGLFLASSQPALLRALLRAYGYPPLDEALSRRLLAYTLLHRYRELRWWLAEFVPPPLPSTLDDLARTVYPL